MLRITIMAVMVLILASAVLDERTAEAKANAVQAGQTFRDCVDCPEMVVVPAGSFVMGSPANEPGFFEIEGPQRRVAVRQFALGKFDVTRGQWAVFATATHRATVKGCSWSPAGKTATWKDSGLPQDDTHPVVCITWADVQDYLRWLSARTGRSYRLPTEAEWEYAARAGTTTAYPWGVKASHEQANYGSDKCCGTGLTSGRDRWVNTSPVGAFPPNAFGLFDMHGNVLQFVQDCFAPSYAGLPTDGTAYETTVTLKMTGDLAPMSGTKSCAYRMVRGGDWGDPPEMIRSAFRNWAPDPDNTLQTYRSTGLSFRVAVTPPL